MFAKALKHNNTLGITKGEQYEILIVMNTSIVIVINNNGDNVLMSKYDFEF